MGLPRVREAKPCPIAVNYERRAKTTVTRGPHHSHTHSRAHPRSQTPAKMNTSTLEQPHSAGGKLLLPRGRASERTGQSTRRNFPRALTRRRLTVFCNRGLVKHAVGVNATHLLPRDFSCSWCGLKNHLPTRTKPLSMRHLQRRTDRMEDTHVAGIIRIILGGMTRFVSHLFEGLKDARVDKLIQGEKM